MEKHLKSENSSGFDHFGSISIKNYYSTRILADCTILNFDLSQQGFGSK